MEIFLAKSHRLTIKKFKHIILPVGYYYYVGSAQKNFTQRILRHLKKRKTVHWHIDHLTSSRKTIIEKIYCFPGSPKVFEEEVSNDFIYKSNAKIILKGFGNSDCKTTQTNLYFLKRKIPYSHFIERYQSIVLFNPSSKEISG